MSVLYCRATRVAGAGIGSAAACEASSRTAAAKNMRDDMDFMMKV